MIGYVMCAGRGDVDLLLHDFAATLMNDGLRVLGTVQINSRCEGPGPCDMDVRILPDGPDVRISQQLGPHARGCRLDPAALEMAVARVTAAMAQGGDVLIVNKFGKHESDGRGFRDVIAAAVGDDIPVVVGVNKTNLPAFLAFTGGEGVQIAPTQTDLRAWLTTQHCGAQQGAA